MEVTSLSDMKTVGSHGSTHGTEAPKPSLSAFYQKEDDSPIRTHGGKSFAHNVNAFTF